MNKDLADIFFKEEEKMYIEDDQFKDQLIIKLEEDIVILLNLFYSINKTK